MKCTKCNVELESGGIGGQTFYFPDKMSFFKRFSNPTPLKALRCPKCGKLELYAFLQDK